MPVTGTARAFSAVAAIVVTAVLALLAWRAVGTSDRLGGIVVVQLFGMLLSPISWTHHWVWVLPLMIWLLHGPLRRLRGGPPVPPPARSPSPGRGPGSHAPGASMWKGATTPNSSKHDEHGKPATSPPTTDGSGQWSNAASPGSSAPAAASPTA